MSNVSRILMDTPREGLTVKTTQVILSPPESEIDASIGTIDPEYAETLRRGKAKLRSSTSSKMRFLLTQAGLTPSKIVLYEKLSPEYLEELMKKFLADAANRTSIDMSIRGLFGQFVKPKNVLPYFHVYDPNVLTDLDIKDVRDLTKQEGNITGALELYDRLHKYDGWLPCLISVLRDPHVNLNDLADLIMKHLGAAATTSQLLLDPEVKAHVADSLRDKFRMLLKPLVVLPLFHKYDPNVLTQEDIDEVVRITNEMGDEAGSDELLDRLVNYPGWYPCLMKVLQDKDVQMSDLAKYISETLDSKFDEFKLAYASGTDEILYKDESLTARERARAREKARGRGRKGAKPGETESESSSSDFDLDEDDMINWMEMSEEERQLLKMKMKELKKARLRALQLAGNIIKYKGLDADRPLKPHKMKHLPTEVELVQQKLQLLEDREKIELIQEPGLHERMWDPWEEGKKYVEKFAIKELLAFMFFRVIKDRPRRPVDYIIDLTREIRRLQTIQSEVASELEEKRRIPETEGEGAAAAAVKEISSHEKIHTPVNISDRERTSSRGKISGRGKTSTHDKTVRHGSIASPGKISGRDKAARRGSTAGRGKISSHDKTVGEKIVAVEEITPGGEDIAAEETTGTEESQHRDEGHLREESHVSEESHHRDEGHLIEESHVSEESHHRDEGHPREERRVSEESLPKEESYSKEE